MDYLKDALEWFGSTGTFNIEGNDLLGKLGLWQVVGIDLVLVGVVDSAGEGAVGTSSFNSSYWKGSCRCDDRRQLGLEGCAKARVGRQVLEVLLGTIATLAFGCAERLVSWRQGLASSFAWAAGSASSGRSS